jgi:hypothetical protein
MPTCLLLLLLSLLLLLLKSPGMGGECTHA